MALKAVSFKTDEARVKAMKEMCEAANMTQADFINQSIDRMIHEIVCTESGGMIVSLPSPYFNLELSKEEKAQILDLLNETSYKFSKIAGAHLDLGLNEIKKFAEYRLNAFNTKRDKEKFMNNFIRYSKIQVDLMDELKGGFKK